ncbi:MAG: hypothetical protein ACLFQK_12125 [Fibrobacterota bacterium]
MKLPGSFFWAGLFTLTAFFSLEADKISDPFFIAPNGDYIITSENSIMETARSLGEILEALPVFQTVTLRHQRTLDDLSKKRLSTRIATISVDGVPYTALDGNHFDLSRFFLKNIKKIRVSRLKPSLKGARIRIDITTASFFSDAPPSLHSDWEMGPFSTDIVKVMFERPLNYLYGLNITAEGRRNGNDRTYSHPDQINNIYSGFFNKTDDKMVRKGTNPENGMLGLDFGLSGKLPGKRMINVGYLSRDISRDELIFNTGFVSDTSSALVSSGKKYKEEGWRIAYGAPFFWGSRLSTDIYRRSSKSDRKSLGPAGLFSLTQKDIRTGGNAGINFSFKKLSLITEISGEHLTSEIDGNTASFNYFMISSEGELEIENSGLYASFSYKPFEGKTKETYSADIMLLSRFSENISVYVGGEKEKYAPLPEEIHTGTPELGVKPSLGNILPERLTSVYGGLKYNSIIGSADLRIIEEWNYDPIARRLISSYGAASEYTNISNRRTISAETSLRSSVSGKADNILTFRADTRVGEDGRLFYDSFYFRNRLSLKNRFYKNRVLGKIDIDFARFHPGLAYNMYFPLDRKYFITRPEPYFDVDITLSMKVKGFRLYYIIENLYGENRNPNTSFHLPGLNFIYGFSWELKGI